MSGKGWIAAMALLALLMLGVCAQAEEPSELALSSGTLAVRRGGVFQLTFSGSDKLSGPPIYLTDAPNIVSVTPQGVLTAVRNGRARVRAILPAEGNRVLRTMRVTVQSKVSPKKIALDGPTGTLEVGKTYALSARALPVCATQTVRWQTFNAKLATISQQGIVTPRAAGRVRIAARSAVNSRIYVIRTFNIIDPTLPTAICLDATKLNMRVGEKAQITISLSPETAQTDIAWKNSDPAVASVDKDGWVRALEAGETWLTAYTARGRLKATARVVVGDPTAGVSLIVPERVTTPDAGRISDNLRRIEDVKDSAMATISALESGKTISASEAADRRAVIERAFKFYRFPWITDKRQPYWKAANSMGGKKDYLPGVVYYGMPYTQKGRTALNRQYDVSRALSEKRFVAAGDVYMLNRSRLLGGSYVGNDCSSFASMSQRASGISRYARCDDMARSKAYRQMADAQPLRPGDMLLKSGTSSNHVVIFLYYTNAERTRAMILEQGGGNAYDIHNTVTCSIISPQTYRARGFRTFRKRGYQ